MIVVHCSGSRCNHPYTVEQLRHDHVEVNGWFDIGYHYYITREGKVHECRPVERMGAHARGANANSIGICYEGGLDANGCIADTRTAAQKDAMFWLIINLHHRFPDIKVILGHRDLPGVQKACPASMPPSCSRCWRYRNGIRKNHPPTCKLRAGGFALCDRFGS